MVAFKNQSTRSNVLSVFFVAAPKSRSVYIGARSTILFQDRIKISHTNPMYIYPHKRNLDALLKVGVTAVLQLATTVVCPHQLKPSNRHTSCPGSRAGTPVCQRAKPAVAVVRYSWCRAGGFIRAAVGCVCCWAVVCCVRAGHLAAGGSLPGTSNKYSASFLQKNSQNIAKVGFPTYAMFLYVRTTYGGKTSTARGRLKLQTRIVRL